MNPQVKKNFDHPNETRPIKKGKVEVLNMGPGLPGNAGHFRTGLEMVGVCKAGR